MDASAFPAETTVALILSDNSGKKKKDDDDDNDNANANANDKNKSNKDDAINDILSQFHDGTRPTLSRSSSGCSRGSRGSRNSTTTGTFSNINSPIMSKVNRTIGTISNKTISAINKASGKGISNSNINGTYYYSSSHQSNINNTNTNTNSFFIKSVGISIFFASLLVFYTILDFQRVIGNAQSSTNALLLNGKTTTTTTNIDTTNVSTSDTSLPFGIFHVDVTSTGTKDGVCHPCIQKYIQRIKDVGLFGDHTKSSENIDNTTDTNINNKNKNVNKKIAKTKMGNETVMQAWENMLCRPHSSDKLISTKPFIIGVGPGTTATRSFALAVNFLRRSVLHFKVYLHRFGVRIWDWDVVNTKYHIDELGEALYGEYDDWLTIVDRIDFASTFHDVDAVFDFPFPFYALDFLRAFPNAKILMTHRDPARWYQRRKEFCSVQKTWREKKACSTPFLLRPWRISNTDKGITEEKSIETFYATEEVLKCLVGPDRYLQVDAWDPPRSDDEGSWMPELAQFVGTPVPPSENCTIPKKPTHNLECDVEDDGCKRCYQYANTHRNEYLPKDY